MKYVCHCIQWAQYSWLHFEKGRDCPQASGLTWSTSVAAGLFAHSFVLCLQHKLKLKGRQHGSALWLKAKRHLLFFSSTACTQSHSWGQAEMCLLSLILQLGSCYGLHGTWYQQYKNSLWKKQMWLCLTLLLWAVLFESVWLIRGILLSTGVVLSRTRTLQCSRLCPHCRFITTSAIYIRKTAAHALLRMKGCSWPTHISNHSNHRRSRCLYPVWFWAFYNHNLMLLLKSLIYVILLFLTGKEASSFNEFLVSESTIWSTSTPNLCCLMVFLEHQQLKTSGYLVISAFK